MQQQYNIKVTLPNGRERLDVREASSIEEAFMATRNRLLSFMTAGGYFSSQEAAHEIEYYEVTIATIEEMTRLVYHRLQQHDVSV